MDQVFSSGNGFDAASSGSPRSKNQYGNWYSASAFLAPSRNTTTKVRSITEARIIRV